MSEAEVEMTAQEGKYNDIKKQEEKIKNKIAEYTLKIKDGRHQHK